MELTERQQQIIRLVEQQEPITGERIAHLLGVGKTTLRSDLSLLVMVGYLNAKPKVGYTLGNVALASNRLPNALQANTVGDIYAMPVIIRENTSVDDAVVTLFVEDVGTLIVADENNVLQGIVSRKDLLKVTLNNARAPTVPVSLCMTRTPKLITVTKEESILEAMHKIGRFNVDSLPVVKPLAETADQRMEVIGRVSKTLLISFILQSI